MKTGIELIAEERGEHFTKHGRTIERDVEENYARELSQAARAILYGNEDDFVGRQKLMPDDWNRYNPTLCRTMCQKSYKERLIVAGSWMAAEIDRLQYQWEEEPDWRHQGADE